MSDLPENSERPQKAVVQPPLVLPLRVEMKDLRRVMAYLAIVESVQLGEVEWTENGEVVLVTAEELSEWKFTGMNNRDFALMVLEAKSRQNANCPSTGANEMKP